MFMELNAQTAEEHLSAIRADSKARRRYAFIQMLAVILIALAVLAAVAMLLPQANAVLAEASAALEEMEAVAAEMAAISKGLSEVDVAGMAERLDALVVQSSLSLTEVTEGVEEALLDMRGALALVQEVDFDSLNDSIDSLSSILEPLARLFGR